MKLRATKNFEAAIALSVIMTCFASACAIKGKTPEGFVANYGVKIGRSVAAAQDAVGTVGKTSTNLEVKKGALAALKGLDKVNTAGIKLADTLDKIVTLRKAGSPVDGTLFDQAQAIIDDIDAALALDVIPHLGDSEEVRAALESARAVSKLVLSIQLQLGQWQGAK